MCGYRLKIVYRWKLLASEPTGWHMEETKQNSTTHKFARIMHMTVPTSSLTVRSEKPVSNEKQNDDKDNNNCSDLEV